MTKDLVDEPDDATHVIFSFEIESPHRIPALDHLREPGHKRHGKDDLEDFYYQAGHSSFEESDWSIRADKLDAAVREAISRLDSTGVDLQELRHPDVFVRAFFTFDPGAETIQADIVEALARYHATIWIDA